MFRIIVGIVVLASLGIHVADARVNKGDRASSFASVKDAQGKLVKVKTFRDRVVVLTFGASWCKPCQKELVAYEKLASKYDREKAVFLAINVDKDEKKGKAFMKKANLDAVQALFDPQNATVKAYDPPTMPTTYIINRGIVTHVHAGYRSGDEKKIGAVLDNELR